MHVVRLSESIGIAAYLVKWVGQFRANGSYFESFPTKTNCINLGHDNRSLDWHNSYLATFSVLKWESVHPNIISYASTPPSNIPV